MEMPACKIASFLKLVQNSRTLHAQHLPAASAMTGAPMKLVTNATVLVLCSWLQLSLR